MTEDQWRSTVTDRLTAIEQRLTEVEKEDAVANYRWKAFEKDLNDIKSGQTWLVRLVLGTLVVAIITFATSGGLIIQ